MVLPERSANLELSIDQNNYLSGDIVSITASFAPQEDFRVRAWIIGLQCIETYMTTGGGKHSYNVETTQNLFQVWDRFLENTDAKAGFFYREQVYLTIPDPAVPSTVGKTANIRWQVIAKVDVPRARDFTRIQTLEVFNDKAPMPEGVSSPTPARFSGGELFFELASHRIGARQFLEGTLHAELGSEINVREVRVFLDRYERAGIAKTTTEVDRIVVSIPEGVLSGGSHQWPFRFRIPDGLPPSMIFSKTTVTWTVTGVLDQPNSSDAEIKRIIEVYVIPPE